MKSPPEVASSSDAEEPSSVGAAAPIGLSILFLFHYLFYNLFHARKALRESVSVVSYISYYNFISTGTFNTNWGYF